jgi:hypothetical protein
MPPKKQVTKVGAPGQAVAAEEDLSDVAQLPLLNQFVFTTLFAFKYRKNCYDLE